jgi:hypothetical protein
LVTHIAYISLSNKDVPFQVPHKTATNLYTVRGPGGAQRLSFGTDGQTPATTGIVWDASSTSIGQLGVVQTIIYDSYSQVIAGVTYRDMIKKNAAGAIFAYAPFPLLDGSATDTTPWYTPPSNPHLNGDTPSLDLTGVDSAAMALFCMDYVMYNPGGCWVPVAKFTWHVNATATQDLFGWWHTTDVTGPAVTSLALAHSWPPTWGDVESNWGALV